MSSIKYVDPKKKIRICDCRAPFPQIQALYRIRNLLEGVNRLMDENDSLTVR
jgi:hypothetical protein